MSEIGEIVLMISYVFVFIVSITALYIERKTKGYLTGEDISMQVIYILLAPVTSILSICIFIKEFQRMKFLQKKG